MKEDTKQCHNCGSKQLALFTSQNKKLCTVCHTELNWYLDEGQKPLISSSADRGFINVTCTDKL